MYVYRILSIKSRNRMLFSYIFFFVLDSDEYEENVYKSVKLVYVMVNKVLVYLFICFLVFWNF